MSIPAHESRPAEAEPSAHESVFELSDIYREHADFVWRAVRRFGVAEESAEDVLHEVFLVLQRRLHEYDGRASMTS